MPKALTDAQVDEFRGKLRRIATQQFAELGYEGTTMRSLAKEAGCSAMTPYRYFDSKEEIFAAVCANALKRLTGICEAAARLHPVGIASSQAIGEAYFSFAMKEPQAYQIMFGEARPFDVEYPELAVQMERNRVFFEGLTSSLVEEGILSGDPIKLGNLFWSAMHGVVILHLTGRLDPDIDTFDLFETMLLVLGRGAKGPNYDSAVTTFIDEQRLRKQPRARSA